MVHMDIKTGFEEAKLSVCNINSKRANYARGHSALVLFTPVFVYVYVGLVDVASLRRKRTTGSLKNGHVPARCERVKQNLCLNLK